MTRFRSQKITMNLNTQVNPENPFFKRNVSFKSYYFCGITLKTVFQPFQCLHGPCLEQRPSASLLEVYSYNVNRSPLGCINFSCAVCFPFLSHTREGRVLISWKLLKIHTKSLLLFLLLLLLKHLSVHPPPGAQSRTKSHRWKDRGGLLRKQ